LGNSRAGGRRGSRRGSLAGSVVSTYGGKGRDRRKARSRALNCLEKLEIARRDHSDRPGTHYDREAFTALCAKCMIAGVPRSVVSVYDHICRAADRFAEPDAAGSGKTIDPERLAEEAAVFLRDALWRPQATRISRRRRARKLDQDAGRCFGESWSATWQPLLARRRAPRPASTSLGDPL
jgi:hypothetical protein